MKRTDAIGSFTIKPMKPSLNPYGPGRNGMAAGAIVVLSMIELSALSAERVIESVGWPIRKYAPTCLKGRVKEMVIGRNGSGSPALDSTPGKPEAYSFPVDPAVLLYFRRE